jgi:hypothetical protein
MTIAKCECDGSVEKDFIFQKGFMKVSAVSVQLFRCMREMLQNHGLAQHINDPTHTSGHTLDWIITRELDNIVASSVVSSLLTDHHSIHFTLDTQKPALPRKQITFRSYKKLDLDALKSDILESSLVENPAILLDDLQKQYVITLKSLIDKHAPVKTKIITVRPLTLWYSEEINEAKKLRRKFEKKWRETKLCVHHQMYLEQKANVSKMISDAKTNYFTNKVLECGKDQKALFRVIDTLQGKDTSLNLPTHSSLQ